MFNHADKNLLDLEYVFECIAQSLSLVLEQHDVLTRKELSIQIMTKAFSVSCLRISGADFVFSIGRLIAPMLARVHTLDVPIPKEPEVMTCARGWLSKFRQTAGGARPIHVRCTAARVPAQSVSYGQILRI